jgi:hypothetical protein
VNVAKVDRPRLVTEEVEQGILRDYEHGTKLMDIEHRYGVARATVYWVLERNGVAPSRAKQNARMTGDEQQLRSLYELLQMQDATIVRLMQQLRDNGIEPEFSDE